METDNSLSFSDQYSFQNTNLNELNYSNILYDENNMYITASNKNYYLFNSFLHKKRTIQNDNYNFVPQLYHKEHQESLKCFKCYSSYPGDILECQKYFRTFHIECLNNEEFDSFINEESFLCIECKSDYQQMYTFNREVINKPFVNNELRYYNTEIQELNDYNVNTSFSSFSENSDIHQEILSESYREININEDINNLFISPIQYDKNMTNEERLLIIIEHDKNFYLHPYIISILKQRKNKRSNFNSSKHYNTYNKLLNITNNHNTFLDNNNKIITNNIILTNQTDSSFIQEEIHINQDSQNPIQLNPNIQKNNSHNNISTYQTNPQFPNGKEIHIKYNLLNKLIIIWDFLYTFNDTFELIKLNIANCFEQFYEDLFNDINNAFFRDILICFVYIAIKNLKIIETNSINKEIYIVKSFLNNPNSLTYYIFRNCIYEILRILTNCTLYSYLINENTQLIINDILQENSFNISIEHKIILLHLFISISYETVIIRNKIQKEIEEEHILSNEKDTLQNIIKEIEKRKNQIEKKQNLLIMKDQIEKLKQKLNQYNVKENQKMKNDILFQITQSENVLKENRALNERQQDALMKINTIQEKISSLKIPIKKMIGSDYRKCDYFYFRSIPQKIYKKDINNKKWYVIDNETDIQELTNKLSDKDIREKQLKGNMKKIIQKIQINENKDNNGIIIQIKDTEKEICGSLIKKENSYKNDYKIKKFSINKILIEIERKYTEYLIQFNKEWESDVNRNKWKEIIMNTNEESNFITTLRMFNHRFNNPYKTNLAEIDGDEPYLILDDIEKYVFIDDEGKEFGIYKTDPVKNLSKKVKIWSKDMEINEIDKYYTNVILTSITNTQQLNFALHLFEEVIFDFFKRRENKKNGHLGIVNNLL